MQSKKNNYVRHDQYYTKPDTAKKCIASIKTILSFSDYDIILEPSAGTGAFYTLLPPDLRVGIDIEPKCDGVIQTDFLQTEPLSGKVLTIGNPPFGVQSKLAVKFFNYAAVFSSEIAFIVPAVWRKWSIHRKLDKKFSLVKNYKIPYNSFTHNNCDYNVNCVFQLWTCSMCKKDMRIKQAPITTHPDFSFLANSKKNQADFLMVVCGARRELIHEINSTVSRWTVERIKIHVKGVREIFEAINWHKYSNTGTGTMWINRATIVKEYVRKKFQTI